MNRHLVSASLGLLIAPLISVCRTSQPPAAPAGRDSSTGRVLTAGDITYLGAIRMPAGTDTTYAFGNLTGRIVNGQVHLFVYGNNPTLHDPVYEIVDPGSGYSTDYTKAPRATLYANWGDIYQGKRVSFHAKGNSVTPYMMTPAGLFWSDRTHLLYWTYNSSFNVEGFPDWSLGASSLDDLATSATTSYGPWRTKATDADGRVHYGPWRCLYLWESPLDGSFLCGSTPQSGDAGSPFGPDMYGMAAWPNITTPPGNGNPDLVLTTRWLESYFMGNPHAPDHFRDGALVGRFRSFRRRTQQALWEEGYSTNLRANPALNGGIGSWTEVDRTTGGIWLQLTNVRGVIFSTGLAGATSQTTTDCANAAHQWYSNGGVGHLNCAHGCPPPGDFTGPMTTQGFPALVIYNPSDLAAVANTSNDYTPEPTSVLNMVDTYGVQVHAQDGYVPSLDGFYFDPVRKYLFMVARHVDRSGGQSAGQSIIHVFAIHDAPTLVPAPVPQVPVPTPVPAAVDPRLYPSPRPG